MFSAPASKRACGRSRSRRRPAGPRYLASAERLQPGGGGESSRASGISRLQLLREAAQAHLARPERPCH